jgi:hypothetical protein
MKLGEKIMHGSIGRRTFTFNIAVKVDVSESQLGV